MRSLIWDVGCDRRTVTRKPELDLKPFRRRARHRSHKLGGRGRRNAAAPSGELCAASHAAACVVRSGEWNADTDCVDEASFSTREFVEVAVIARLVRRPYDA